jgi:hypothetical protein
MPMRASTIRFPERIWDVLGEEAEAEGVTTSQFIRDSALIRAIWLRTTRGEIDPNVEIVNRAVRELCSSQLEPPQ